MKPDDPHGDLHNIITMHLDGATKTDAFQSLNHDQGIPTAVSNIVRTLSLYRGRSAGVYPFNAYKELGAEVALKALRIEPEQRYTLGLSYPANRADRAVAADGFRDFARPDVLERAAWSYMRKRAVGLLHHKGTEGRGEVVESYIYRGPDWEIVTPSGEKTMIKAGDWLLGIIWDVPSWDAIKKGKLTGLSPQAKVRRRIPSAETLAGLRSD